MCKKEIYGVGRFYTDGERFYKRQTDPELMVCGNYSVYTSKELSAVDPATFNCLFSQDIPNKFGGVSEYGYYTDSVAVYYDLPGAGLGVLPNADPNEDFASLADECGSPSFIQIGDNFYYSGRQITFDPRIAVDLGGLYVGVQNKIYYAYVEEVVGVDIKTFETYTRINDNSDLMGVARDRKYVYMRELPIPDADPETFHFLDACVGKERERYVECDVQFYAVDEEAAYFLSPTFNHVKRIKTKHLNQFRFYVDPARNNYGFATDGVYEYSAGKAKRLA